MASIDHTGARHAGRAHGSQNSCQYNDNLLGQGQVDSITGSDKHSAKLLVNSGSVHIDGSAQRKYKTGNLFSGPPNFPAHSRLRGRAPTEDATENAIIMAGAMPLENLKGSNARKRLHGQRIQFNEVMEYVPDISHQKHKGRSCPVSSPLAATTGVIRQNTPMGLQL